MLRRAVVVVAVAIATFVGLYAAGEAGERDHGVEPSAPVVTPERPPVSRGDITLGEPADPPALLSPTLEGVEAPRVAAPSLPAAAPLSSAPDPPDGAAG